MQKNWRSSAVWFRIMERTDRHTHHNTVLWLLHNLLESTIVTKNVVWRQSTPRTLGSFAPHRPICIRWSCTTHVRLRTSNDEFLMKRELRPSTKQPERYDSEILNIWTQHGKTFVCKQWRWKSILHENCTMSPRWDFNGLCMSVDYANVAKLLIDEGMYGCTPLPPSP